ncbi:hypothetical protein L1987_73078 [Smallanthus sonchifolius]|uniref:Uncharacterized protein n=1 Tax=Smallanthus sonchifolius TaxID=185202 RepID=A0ACB9A020_9ASTR|nr:hypothetical protein L1987_73078 [Smallanthus sonchifolius]
MKESKGDGESLVLDIEKFKGDFLYDALFANLVNGMLPSFIEEEADSMEGMSTTDTLSSGRSAKGLLSPLFPKVETLLLIFKDSCTQLAQLLKQVLHLLFFLHLSMILLCIYAPDTFIALTCSNVFFKIDGKLQKLKKDVVAQDSKHRKTLGEVIYSSRCNTSTLEVIFSIPNG